MPVTTYTLTGDFSALVGEVSKIRATVHANGEDDSWVNETDLKVILGGALLSVNETGAFTASLPTSTGTGLQYEVRAEYVDEATRRRNTWRSGWFDLTANGNLATLANDSSLRVNPSLGDVLAGRIDDTEERLDALEAGGGTEALAQRVDGYVDHGNVYGGVTLTGPTASHWFTATAPTTITLEGYEEGQVVTLICFAGAEDVTVNGAGDTALVDGTAWSAMLARGAWISGGGGGEPVTPDTTPPSAVTDLAATPGSDGSSVTLTFSAATDAESAVNYRARVYKTGTTPPAWPTSGPLYGLTGSPVVVTGLDGGSAYTAELHSYSAGGASATDTATFNTPAELDTIFTDTFTGTGTLTSHAANSGQTWTGSTEGSIITTGRLTTGTGNVRSTHGAQAREATCDLYFTAPDGVQLFPWDAATGTDGGSGPRGYVHQNGQVSLSGLSAVTYNASGGSENYTPSGFVALPLNATHPMKLTYDGSLLALYVNDTKIIEGTPATAPSGTKVAVNTGPSAYIDNLIIKAVS